MVLAMEDCSDTSVLLRRNQAAAVDALRSTAVMLRFWGDPGSVVPRAALGSLFLVTFSPLPFSAGDLKIAPSGFWSGMDWRPAGIPAPGRTSCGCPPPEAW